MRFLPLLPVPKNWQIKKMRLEIKLVPRARKEGILRQAGFLKVKVMSPPADNRANRDMLMLLSEYFGIPLHDIRILSGLRSTRKLVGIKEENREKVNRVLSHAKAYKMEK